MAMSMSPSKASACRAGVILASAVGLVGSVHASEGSTLIAVASSVMPVAEALKSKLQSETEADIQLAGGATGTLFAQARLGAPYDAFIAADQTYLDRLGHQGAVVANSRVTYAVGRLVLVGRGELSLNRPINPAALGAPLRIALPNPKLAPYGVAAREALVRLDAFIPVRYKTALGTNVGQTFALVHSGNAQLGLVALSTVLGTPLGEGLRYEVVPRDWHSDVRHDAAILLHGKSNPLARLFLELLVSESGRAVLGSHGYEPP